MVEAKTKKYKEIFTNLTRNADTKIYVFPGFYVQLNREAVLRAEKDILDLMRHLNSLIEMKYGDKRGLIYINYTRAEIESILSEILSKDQVLLFLSSGSILGLWEIKPTPIDSLMNSQDRLLWSSDGGKYLPYILLTPRGRALVKL